MNCYWLAALAMFAGFGLVRWDVAALLSAGTGAGGWVGSRVAVKRGAKWIRAFTAEIAIALREESESLGTRER